MKNATKKRLFAIIVGYFFAKQLVLLSLHQLISNKFLLVVGPLLQEEQILN